MKLRFTAFMVHVGLRLLYLIHDKNCSLSIVLTAMDQKLQKS